MEKTLISKFKTKTFRSPYARPTDPTEVFLVLNPEQFQEIRALANQVCFLHQDRTAKDHGTCVLGAGIRIKYFEPRKRSLTYRIVVSAPFQGNVGSYQALKPVLAYLNEHYPELHAAWDDGNMD